MRTIKNRIRKLENKSHDRRGLPQLILNQEPGNEALYFKMPDYGGPRLTLEAWEDRYPDHEIVCRKLTAADREKVLSRRRKVRPILDKLHLLAPEWWGDDNE